MESPEIPGRFIRRLRALPELKRRENRDMLLVMSPFHRINSPSSSLVDEALLRVMGGDRPYHPGALGFNR